MGGFFDMSLNGYLYLDSWGELNNINWILYFLCCWILNYKNIKSVKF